MSGDLAELFSRKMRVGGIGAGPMRREIAADAGECAALAKIFGLPAIASLSGEFSLGAARAGGAVDAELRLRARLTQICVVSLEPFEATLVETAQLRFVPAASLPEDVDFAAIDPETLDDPDEIPYSGDSIDLGAALAEQLALALDPYPRKPGVELPASAGAAELPTSAGEAPENPFAALAARRLGPEEGSDGEAK